MSRLLLSSLRNLVLFPFLFLAGFLFATEINTVAPPLVMANVYEAGMDLDDYWVSEKLDGVRAYWNGAQLVSRNGNIFNTPLWFIENFPTTPLDGELWIERGKFELVSGLVRRKKPSNEDWENVKYMVFDLPASAMTFDLRLLILKDLVEDLNLPQLQLVQQFKVADEQSLLERLNQLVALDAEGLMLHLGTSLYTAERSDDLLKLKPVYDAEAWVIAYVPGKGKYTGMVGSLLVKNKEGKKFKLGSGLTDDDRLNPPPIGAQVTYQFSGMTKNGIPRFARFLRRKTHH